MRDSDTNAGTSRLKRREEEEQETEKEEEAGQTMQQLGKAAQPGGLGVVPPCPGRPGVTPPRPGGLQHGDYHTVSVRHWTVALGKQLCLQCLF